MEKLRIALVGNPNAGKSTIFNALTGAHQHVGNWPGKTVEKKVGKFSYNGCELEIVDLPGSYSLSAFSVEEVIARNFIIDERPDLVVTVVDAANLERNLYLAVQVLEMGMPTVVALNMSDVAAERGIRIDVGKLSHALRVPVVATIASKGRGIDELVAKMVDGARAGGGAVSRQHKGNGFHVDYGSCIEPGINRLLEATAKQEVIREQFPDRWLVLKLLEGDENIRARLGVIEGGATLLSEAEQSIFDLSAALDDDLDTVLADKRYGWINDLVRDVALKTRPLDETFSDKLDELVTHRWLGVPIFLMTMWVVFKLTTDVSAPFLDWMEGVFSGPLSRWGGAVLGAVGLGGTWVESLFVDGVLAGVGGVLVFVPVLISLFLALAILEESGYMARAAFVMDGFMRPLGLHGKSFLPMLVGFGCTVPAFYATRTLENEKDRVLTGLLVPFMSCGARLPVYVLFATVFFPVRGGVVVFGVYLLGIFTAIILGIILRKSVFRGKEQSNLIMELPPYRLPTIKGIWSHVAVRTGGFVKNAWTIILVTSVIIWLLMAIPVKGQGDFANTDVDDSAFAMFSGALAPALRPLGFEGWETSGALISGFIAKEVVVSSLSQVYGVEDHGVTAEKTTFGKDLLEIGAGFVTASIETIRAVPSIVGIDLVDGTEDTTPSNLMLALREAFEFSSDGHGALAGLAFMVFVLIYTPCMAAVAAERQELGVRWMWVSVVGQLALAWLMAFVVFQGGKLLGLG